MQYNIPIASYFYIIKKAGFFLNLCTMSTCKFVSTLVLLLSAFTACRAQQAGNVPKEIMAKIDPTSKTEPIPGYIYGKFIENLENEDVGNLVDDCLWSEMLDDRKFFYPADLKEKLIPINTREKINQWKPLNNPDAVIMDSINPYIGVHSPKIKIRTNV